MYSMSGNETEAFVSGYVEACAWANAIQETADGDITDSDITPDDLPADVLETLRQDCVDFLSDPQTEQLVRAYVRRSAGRRGFDHAGHDFALTRNGHGAGYWDRGLGMLGEALTKLAKPYGDRTLYVDANGSVSTD